MDNRAFFKRNVSEKMVMRSRVKFYIFESFVFPTYRVDEKLVSNQKTESRRTREREREKKTELVGGTRTSFRVTIENVESIGRGQHSGKFSTR